MNNKKYFKMKMFGIPQEGAGVIPETEINCCNYEKRHNSKFFIESTMKSLHYCFFCEKTCELGMDGTKRLYSGGDSRGNCSRFILCSDCTGQGRKH